MPKKFFHIHLEVGDVHPGTFYAKTILGNNAVKFEHQGRTPGEAMKAVIHEMERAGIWSTIAIDPQGMAPFPFKNGAKTPAATTTTTTTTTPPASKKDPDPVKKRPVDLGRVPKGKCEALCISYDNFGAAKCSSICGTKAIPNGALTPAQRK